MVNFMDVAATAGWIRHVGLEAALTDVVRYVEADFRRWETFERAPRVASHSPVGVIELMPTSDGTEYGFKYVNGHPSNPTLGLQTVTAFGVLAEVASGYPTFLAEMTLLTAMRTAATSALAARTLARPGATTMAMVGTGSQAEFQALAFRAQLGIERLRVFDVDDAAIAKFARNAVDLGFSLTTCASAEEAAHGADVITTCTADKQNATVLPDAAIRPGVHLNAIGGDCPGKTELDAVSVERAKVFVEHEAQTRIEGEIQQVSPAFAVTELWQVLTGRAHGRTSSDDITLFDSVGFAIEDFSVLRCVRDAVVGGPFVQTLDLIAEPRDPKDLFALVDRARVVA